MRNKKFLLKIITAVLIFVTIAPIAVDAFNATAAFAADITKGELPFENVNRDHLFRLVEMCWPQYLQKLIRKLANWAIDKVVEMALRLIPYVGGIVGKIWDGMKVFREMIDLPIYPRCHCKDDDNTQDSTFLPMNWRFAQNYISKEVEKRRKETFPRWEARMPQTNVKDDISGFSDLGEEVIRAVDRYYDLRLEQYGPTFLLNANPYDSVYPSYSGFNSVISEDDRLTERWRKNELGHLWVMGIMHNALFDKDSLNSRNLLLEKMFSIESDVQEIKTGTRTVTETKSRIVTEKKKKPITVKKSREVTEIKYRTELQEYTYEVTITMYRMKDNIAIHMFYTTLKSNAWYSYDYLVKYMKSHWLIPNSKIPSFIRNDFDTKTETSTRIGYRTVQVPYEEKHLEFYEETEIIEYEESRIEQYTETHEEPYTIYVPVSGKTGMAQTAQFQYLGVGAKLFGAQTWGNAFTAFSLTEMGLTPLQNKRSIKNAAHTNIDLMGHNAATKTITRKKAKLGF